MRKIHLGALKALTRHTNLFASPFQNSSPRRKLTRMTLLGFVISSISTSNLGLEPDSALRAAYRNRKTNQFPVALNTELINVKDGRNDADRCGAMRGGTAGWDGIFGKVRAAPFVWSNETDGFRE